MYKEFGFNDDLYNYFTCKQFDLLKVNGILSYITSNTFFVIKSKLNMRRLLQSKYIKEIIVTPRAFNALVDTSIFIVKNKEKEEYNLKFIDTSKCSVEDYYNLDLASYRRIYETDINLYRNNIDNVFFIPDSINMQIYEKIITKAKELYNTWWTRICGSDIYKKNKNDINEYIDENIIPRQLTLLGLIVDGGVGLQTGDNGKYLGIRKGSKLAETSMSDRLEKFYKNIIKVKNNKAIFEKEYPNYSEITSKEEAKVFLDKLSEYEIRDIFDKFNKTMSKNVFGRGVVFKIINENEIKIIDEINEKEKFNGINEGLKVYVPYDKGDKDGNRWYSQTPFYINWSGDCVNELKTSKKSRWQGYEFYFKEGFCWNLVNGTRVENDLKFRIIEKSVNDVGGMKLCAIKNEYINNNYITALCNSKLINKYTESFINFTLNFQINDARKIPIIIPTKEQLSYINNLVDEAIKIKKLQFSKNITEEKSQIELQKIQDEIDKFVYKLYDIKLED